MQATSSHGWSARTRRLVHDAPATAQVVMFVAAAALPVYLGFAVAHALPHVGAFRSSSLVSWITIGAFPVPWFIIELIIDTITRPFTGDARQRPGARGAVGRVLAEALPLLVLVLLALIVLRSPWGCLVAAAIAQALHHVASPFLDLDD